MCALPDSDTARHSCIQAKFEATEGGAQLLIGELGSGLAGELLPGLGGVVFQGGRRAGLRVGGLLYVGATIFCIGHLQHLHTQLLLCLDCPLSALLKCHISFDFDILLAVAVRRPASLYVLQEGSESSEQSQEATQAHVTCSHLQRDQCLLVW